MNGQVSFAEFSDTGGRPITKRQVSMLISMWLDWARGVGYRADLEGGYDPIVDWLFSEMGINVENLHELTQGQFLAIKEELGG